MKKNMEMKMNKKMAAKQALAVLLMTASMTMTAFAGTSGNESLLPRENYQNDRNREAVTAYMNEMRTRWSADQLKEVHPVDIDQDGVLEYVVKTAERDEVYTSWNEIDTYVMSFDGSVQVTNIDSRTDRYEPIRIGVIPEEKKLVTAAVTAVRGSEMTEFTLENGQLVKGNEYYWDVSTAGSDKAAETELCKTVFTDYVDLPEADDAAAYLSEAAGKQEEEQLYPYGESELGKDVMVNVRYNIH